MVDIVKFPKKCPHCKVVMRAVNKMYVSWFACDNEQCSYLTTQVLETKMIRGVEMEDVPVPFTSNYMKR